MKNRITGIIVVLSASLLLQSCFEIKEILSVNKDGSGSFTMVIDMSEVKEMIESFNSGSGDEAESPLAEMEKEYESTKSKLEVIEGISNITFVTENDGYIIKTGFEFASIDALNRGMSIVYEEETEYGEHDEYYRFKKRNFERTSAHNLLDELMEEMGANELGSEDIDLATIFSDVAYINEVTFTGSTIRKANNESIVISEDRSSMTLKKFIFRESENLSTDYLVKVR